MKPNDLPDNPRPAAAADGDELALLDDEAVPFAIAPTVTPQTSAPIPGVIIGELLALTDGGRVALVRHANQADAKAVRARTTVDLHGVHVGQPVVLMFEHADPARPLVMGVVRGQTGWPQADKPPQVYVDADGERLIVSAKDQLVLRCGKASITLTRAGKVLIEGTYVLSRSTGVNRVKGGSVQMN